MQPCRFLGLDVFADAPGRGNPLAVVADAREPGGCRLPAAHLHATSGTAVCGTPECRHVRAPRGVERSADAGEDWIGGQTQTVVNGVMNW